MTISNGFKSTTFAAVALCFVMVAGSASARPHGTDDRDFPPRMEAQKDDGRIRKVGKVVELQLDVDTDMLSATVAVGTINKPEFPKKGEKAEKSQASEAAAETKNAESKRKGEKRPDFITLSDEKVKIDLSDDVKVIGMRPPFERQGREEPRGGCSCCGNNAGRKQPMMQKKTGRNDFAMGDGPMPFSGGEQLKIGELVQIIYAEDGKSVEAIVPLFPPMARR